MSGVRQTVAPSGLNSVSSNTGMSVEDKLAARAYSGAANALAAAAAAAATSRE